SAVESIFRPSARFHCSVPLVELTACMLPFVSPKKIVSVETIAEVQTSPPAGTSQVLVPLLESIAYNVPPSQLTRTCPEFSEGVEWIGAVVLNRHRTLPVRVSKIGRAHV